MNLFDVVTIDLPAGVAEWWRDAVVRMFGHAPLELLHEWPYLEGPRLPEVLRETDQASRAHAQFYRLFPRVAEAYRELAAELGELVLDGAPFLFQRVPTFRVHFPDNRAVGEAHRDLWYGHQPGELNVWIPLVDAFGSSTVWVQTPELLADHPFAPAADRVGLAPVPVRFGQALIFDGVNLLHGNVLNREGQEKRVERSEDPFHPGECHSWSGRGRTRVSFDFRVLPASLYDPENRRTSVNTGTPMVLGGYWDGPVEPSAGGSVTRTAAVV